MKYQVYWSEEVNPELTEEQKVTYRNLGIEQVYPVGDIVNSRRLFHGIATEDVIDNMLEFMFFKTPKIKNITDKHGIVYGYKKVKTQDESVEDEVQRDENIKILYELTCTTNFFPKKEVEIDGEMVDITSPKHSFSGWKYVNIQIKLINT